MRILCTEEQTRPRGNQESGETDSRDTGAGRCQLEGGGGAEGEGE